MTLFTDFIETGWHDLTESQQKRARDCLNVILDLFMASCRPDKNGVIHRSFHNIHKKSFMNEMLICINHGRKVDLLTSDEHWHCYRLWLYIGTSEGESLLANIVRKE